MRLTAEISFFPTHLDYKPAIKHFVRLLNEHSDICSETFPTCTVVCGEMQRVMSAIQSCMQRCTESFGMGVYTVKYLPDYEAI